MEESADEEPSARQPDLTVPQASQSASEMLDRILKQSTGLSKKPPAKFEFKLQGKKPKTVSERLDDLDLDDREQTIKLKRFLAYGSFTAVGIQLILANAGMYLYAEAIDWRLEPEVVMAWLAATVVETLGVVVVIARNLFPSTPS